MSETVLADVAEIVMGQSPIGSTYNRNGEGVPLLNGPTEFGPIHPIATQWTTAPSKFARAGDVLICVRGNTLGRQNISDGEYAIGRGLAAIRAKAGKANTSFIQLLLQNKASELLSKGNGSTFPSISGDEIAAIPFPQVSPTAQDKIAARLEIQLAQANNARQAARTQLREISSLAGAIVMDTIRNSPTKPYLLGDVLDEVKQGIGASWADHPVLGATREGLAPAKEQPGKMAPKYKPVTPGTVFYNPMRILIGSIAFVDDDDAPGITSPDYVALRGKPGCVDSRWFYYWLRSHLGAQCILSLARGAVRERMLFNRLADGKIDLPSPEAQEKASRALRELKPLQRALKSKLAEIDLLPQKILAQAFEM